MFFLSRLNITSCFFSILFLYTIPSVSLGLVCPPQQLVKSAAMSTADYIPNKGYFVRSSPIYDENRSWFVIDGPFLVKTEKGAIEQGEALLKNTLLNDYTQIPQTTENVNFLFCVYYSGDHHLIVSVKPKRSAHYSLGELLSLII